MMLPQVDVEAVIAAAALVVSLVSLGFSIRASHLQNKVNALEEKLKRIELDDKEEELAKRQESCVKVRYVKISDKKRVLRISNVGGVKVLNVRYAEKEGGGGAVLMHDKEPFEYLEPGDSYDEAVIMGFGGPPKSKIEAVWETEDGVEHRKEYLLAF